MPKAGIVFQKKDEYMTPKEVVDFFGPFDYDPATTDKQAKALGIKNYDTIKTDGLKTDWSKFGKIWVNPPFTRKFEFLEKAIRSKSHVFFLLPIETLTTGKFHNVMKEYEGGYVMWVPDGRIKFDDGSGKSSSPAFGSVVLELQGEKKCIKYWSLNG
jgi:phage N-6-adenine-methyltransferase